MAEHVLTAPAAPEAPPQDPAAPPLLNRLWHRAFPPLTPEQADLLARVKFPCC